ncbi:hypothetical protein A4H97_25195 [Niastella yeongjuensis]|uniref:Uncharacterized protein n=1 Tax=Niastella yeongjuensis TaxID=354355 RepID=A0A1V9F2Y0_9BACT|nr:toxin-antitoxin system YwqK family antitoxin [Niastella yeongjuensis]OQP52622.1 hypothetical protein A4H97_25195 [Niastella yeongjuensis]SEP33543.1 Antitoxin component YwqK of the YwqJK toxin-antitoxin module [Niastella yeongjuensis]
MNRHVTPLITALCFACLYATAQENNPLINSAEAISAGVKLYDNGQYKEALKEYERVKVGDTNYVWALYEMALTCTVDSQYTRGIQVCQEALSLPTERERSPDLLTQYGNLLDYDNQQERALRIFDSALAVYPAYAGLYISKGTTLIRMKKYKEAEQVFKQVLLINPYSAAAHFKLGICALNQGNIVGAYLSLLGNVVMDPGNHYSGNVVTMLDDIAKAKDYVVELVNNRKEEPSANFRFIEQIVLSKIALDNNYKSIIELTDPIAKQLQVICEKLSYDENDNDFYMQFYAPFYQKVFEEKKFDKLVYYAFSGVNSSVIKDFNRKHKKDIEAFVTETVEYLKPIRATRELSLAKRDAKGSCYYFEGGQLIGKGASPDNGNTLTGPWEYYFASGNKKSAGVYNEKGEKEGVWKYYYFTGQLRGEEIYRNGKQEGKETYYYENGNISSTAEYKDGEINGERITYYKNGALRTVEQQENGKLKGNRKVYTQNGLLQSAAMYANDKKSGAFKTYFANGQVELEGSYADDKLSGPYKAYYEDGVVSMEAQYDQDNAVGEIKKFFENGKPKSIETYNNGVLEGEYASWYNNGQVNTKYINKKGKLNGDVQYFDKDGKMYSIFTFDNDLLKAARYFDKTGKQISISEASKGRLNLLSYVPNGTKSALSPYNEKGMMEGTQVYYYGSGKEKETNTYANGELNGESVSYYPGEQKKVTVNYTQGKKDGYYIARYIHGGRQEEGWYKDNEPEGEWFSYNEAGNLTARTNFLNDEMNGLKTEYWPNGKKLVEYLYDRGVLLAMTQYDTTGRVLNQVNLKNGTGKMTTLNVNGKLYSECTYQYGSLEGAYKYYYFDGSNLAVQYFKKGLRDSLYRDFYFGGNIAKEGMYKMGNKAGAWKYYWENGNVSRVDEYKAGQLHGKQTFYTMDGKKDAEMDYENGSRQGFYRKYSSEGVVLYQMRYEEDEPVGYSYRGNNNELVPEIPMTAGNGRFRPLFPNGNAAIDVLYVDGQTNGTYKFYYDNGKLLRERNENYGYIEGVLKEFYADGAQHYVYNYLHNNLHGTTREYNAKGILVEEGNYYNGDYHGETRYFDDNGKLKEVRTYYYGQLLSIK